MEFRGFEIRLESECGLTSGKCKVHEDQLSWTNRNWVIKASKRQIQFLFRHKVRGSRKWGFHKKRTFGMKYHLDREISVKLHRNKGEPVQEGQLWVWASEESRWGRAVLGSHLDYFAGKAG